MAENELIIVRNGHGDTVEQQIKDTAFAELKEGWSDQAQKMLVEACSINPDLSTEIVNKSLSVGIEEKSLLSGQLFQIFPKLKHPQRPEISFEKRLALVTEVLKDYDLHCKKTKPTSSGNVKACTVFNSLI